MGKVLEIGVSNHKGSKISNINSVKAVRGKGYITYKR